MANNPLNFWEKFNQKNPLNFWEKFNQKNPLNFWEKFDQKNPYTNRGTIRNPEEFFGREREIRRIYSRISSSHPQCISIIGERKIGKSSLLYFINHESVRRKRLKDPDSYIFLLIDLQDRDGEMSFSSFFQFVFRTLKGQLNDLPLPPIEEIRTETEFYETFKNIVSNIQTRGLKLIILFDEFGTITGSGHFDSAFFSFLRSIANNYECSYITTSRLRLQNLCRDTDVSESPFFNIFTPVPLGQFDAEEARSLILTPSSQAGISFGERDVEFILSMAGRHPLFIQMACAALFDHKSRAGKVDFEAVKRDFLEEATQQFEDIWREAEGSKQDILCKVALGEDITDQQLYLVHELQRSGYLMEEPVEPFSLAFGEFLISKRPDALPVKPENRASENSLKKASISERIMNLFKRGNSKA